jgi:hypothetical protein
MDPKTEHLLAVTALQSALERVHGSAGQLEMALDDCVLLLPHALGDPPALPSVSQWVIEESLTAGPRIRTAADNKEKVLTYLEML